MGIDLYLVRHGETDENANGIVQGWLNTDLSTIGQQQAEATAMSFDTQIDAIVSSDLNRCIQTASYFRDKYPNIPYSEDARLRERHFGDAQGARKDTQDWEVFWAMRDEVSIPNAETLSDFDGRVQDFLDATRKLSHHAILVVAHGGTISRMLDLTSEDYMYVPVGNSSVTHIALK